MTGGDAPVPASVEQYADLHEYGLNLGIDIDNDEDLIWAVQQAFNAPLPSSWTEYMDNNSRVYYVKEGSSQSTWEHPMDGIYRELLGLIKDVRTSSPAASEAEREEVVRHHLKQVHERATSDLEGWSGPYSSEQGDYYHHEGLKVSTWECPVTEWENELVARHAVLSRYLLPEQEKTLPSEPSSNNGCAIDPAAGAGNRRADLLLSLRLQLGNLQKESVSGDAPAPSTTRSYHTARSYGSPRSGRSKLNMRAADKERKDAQDSQEFPVVD
mmetsp:Transcript_73540/g.207719  ORF Transcript_73540/g.207719 Transcript_73540/m.207719 type:complete len:270 (-) Transcript_73540:160-969(-)